MSVVEIESELAKINRDPEMVRLLRAGDPKAKAKRDGLIASLAAAKEAEARR